MFFSYVRPISPISRKSQARSTRYGWKRRQCAADHWSFDLGSGIVIASGFMLEFYRMEIYLWIEGVPRARTLGSLVYFVCSSCTAALFAEAGTRLLVLALVRGRFLYHCCCLSSKLKRRSVDKIFTVLITFLFYEYGFCYDTSSYYFGYNCGGKYCGGFGEHNHIH